MDGSVGSGERISPRIDLFDNTKRKMNERGYLRERRRRGNEGGGRTRSLGGPKNSRDGIVELVLYMCYGSTTPELAYWELARFGYSLLISWHGTASAAVEEKSSTHIHTQRAQVNRSFEKEPKREGRVIPQSHISYPPFSVGVGPCYGGGGTEKTKIGNEGHRVGLMRRHRPLTCHKEKRGFARG